jgi:predicted TIM-barrel enzyme
MTGLRHMTDDQDEGPWRTARFHIDASTALPRNVLGLHVPAARDLPIADLATLALLPIHDWNGALQEQVAKERAISIERTSACVLATDPFRRIRDLLLELHMANYRWVTNFPSTQTIDGSMRAALDDLGFGVEREFQFVEEAAALGLNVAAYVTSTEVASIMVERGARALVAPARDAIDATQLPRHVQLIELEPIQQRG